MANKNEFELAYEGNIGALRVMLTEEPKLARTKDGNRRMPLHWACSGGRKEVANYLLDQLNVPVNEQDDAGWTPLMIASSAGHDEIVNSLLENKADPNIVNFTGQSVLHYAASRNRLGIAEALLKAGVEVNIQDKTTGATPLHRAASKGYLKMVQLLVEHGAKVNTEDRQKYTPLYLACDEERLDVIRYLLAQGAESTENLQYFDVGPTHVRKKI